MRKQYVMGAPEPVGIKSAPDSARGATKMLSGGKRFYCLECKTLQAVVKVGNDIKQMPASVSYNCILQCGHSRTVTIAVKRPKRPESEE